jgi:perosamine synthetase
LNRIGVGHVETTDAMRANVADVLDSSWFSPGKWCRQFEEEWAALHDRKHSIFMNSGTSALHVGLAAMKERYGWKKGSRVIVPALTFVASVNVILQNGLVPMFVDIDDYYGISGPKFLSAISHLTKDEPVAVMPVHINGQWCDPSVLRLAKLFGMKIIEDSCEAVVAQHNGIPVGAMGDVSCFSTYACHHVTTGVGGFATTNDPELAALIRSIANHGRDGIYFDPDAPAKQLVDHRFRFERQGYSYRASEFEAAVGCAALSSLPADLQGRRDTADALTRGLGSLPLTLPAARPGCEWFPMFYPILSDRRDELCLYLEDHGIETRPFLPLTNQPVYQNLVREADFPKAQRVNREGFYIGCSGLSLDDLTHIGCTFHDFFARRLA